MATLKNKRELPAVTRDNHERSLKNSQSPSLAVLRINEEYITQMLEEIEGKVTKKLSQELSRTKSRILDALYELDEFLLNPQVRVQSGTVPGTSRNMKVENQKLAEDRSQNDPHPEVDASVYRTAQSMDSDPEEASYSHVVKIQLMNFSHC